MAGAKQNLDETERGTQEGFLALQGVIGASSSQRFLGCLVLFNILLVYVRPQEILTFLGAIRLLLIVSVIGVLIWLPKAHQNWTKPTLAMLGFLIMGALWVPFARNNRWAYAGFTELSQQFFCFIFPLIAYSINSVQIHRLLKVFIFSGIYLAIYSLTHAGRGPGGFLGDENDLCLTLTLFLSYALVMTPTSKTRWVKFVYIGSALLMLGGIVASNSRGGFVGLVAAFGYYILGSSRKLSVILTTIVIILVGAIFAPQSYWDEMSTIKNTSTGTADQRKKIWGTAFRVWADPPHIPAGVGMRNIPYWLADYEPAENKTKYGKSIGGRAVHSLYFELLSELGLIGVLLFLMATGGSFLGNRRCLKASREIETIAKRLNSQIKKRLALAKKNSEILGTDLEKSRPSNEEVLSMSLQVIAQESRLISFLCTATNMAWVGVLVAGIFISVFYYPPIWTLVAVSAIIHLYWNKVQSVAIEILQSAEREVMQAAVKDSSKDLSSTHPTS